MIPPFKKPKQKEGSITFEGFPLGLNSSVPPSMITPNELSECVDWKYNSRGQLETRGAIVQYSDVACSGGVATIGNATIDGVERTLIGDDNFNVYYLGGTSGVSCTKIGTATGEANFLSYNNIALVLDGSYVKYLDGVTEIKMAYDTDETFFDNSNGEDDGNVPVSTSGVGCSFTTPSWDAGYTIPPTTVAAKIIATGGASLTATIWDVDLSSAAAVTTYTLEFPTVANFIDIAFAESDVIAELKPDTDYYCLLKGANVDLEYTTVSSGGTLITGGSTPDTTKDPIISIAPGLPPKASYGEVSDKRPFLWGDTDEPGVIPYGKLTHLQWGYLTTVDEDRISFPVGSLQDLYGDLWVYGTEEHPYIATLIGATEATWTVSLTYQRAWSLPNTLANVGNDLFNGSSDGVDSLRGVQAFGDVRSFSESDRIIDKFSNWTSGAFATYYPKDGQYWLYLPGYSKVLVCSIKKPYFINERVGYPWTEYTLPIVPTTFKQAGSKFLIGSGNGHVYTFDTTEYKDLTTTQIEPELRTAYIEFPFSAVNLEMFQFVASSKTGADFNLDIYIDGNQDDPIATYPIGLSMSDALIVDEMIMDVDDAIMLIDPSANPSWVPLNINCWSCQFKIKDLQLVGSPVYLNGMFLKFINTEMIWHS